MKKAHMWTFLACSVLLMGGMAVTGPWSGSAAEAKGDVTAGQTIFKSKCAACHTGGKLLKASSLDKDWAAIIKQGGAKVKRSPAMPSFGSLSDKDIDNLIAYIRTIAKK